MKIFIHRILIAVVCLSTLFLGCIEEENHKIELPIDTPEEAIEYAKIVVLISPYYLFIFLLNYFLLSLL